METKVCKICGRELPIENFKRTRGGTYVSTCTECATKHRRKNEKKYILSQCTPRDLMEELARRGYKGKLTYTRIEEIDITHF